MLRNTISRSWIFRARRVHSPPVNGYEVSELPNEKVFEEYMKQYGRDRLIVAVFHSTPLITGKTSDSKLGGLGDSRITSANSRNMSQQPTLSKSDQGARALIAGFNLVNLGHPDIVKVATIPGAQSPRLTEMHRILAHPTCLLYWNGKMIDRVVGARYHEVSTKALFTLRKEGKEVFSSKSLVVGS
eukprot:Tbor_TRINITY_DN4364_c0_g1::TRINITY_DN4364_c0_g1_i1::g.7835::m.7835